MSAKNSRKIKVGDMVQWQALNNTKYIGIVIERKGALCHIKWINNSINEKERIDYIYASDLEKVS